MKHTTLLYLCLFLSSSQIRAADLPTVLVEDFESGSVESWFPTQPDRWTISDTQSSQNKALHLLGVSKEYNPPFRSPHSIVLLKDKVLGDFVLTAKVKTLQKTTGHRDMCIFWGWQNPSNFYYVHLGEKPDPNSSQIFIVKEAPRSPITINNKGGIPWEEEKWHEVKLVRKVEEGTIEVYFDDMETPAKTATDKTFAWGMIGLGSFDDLGMWDDVKIYGNSIEGKTPVLPTPKRSETTVQK
jgi:quinoprotein glucose dehydrogenase